MYVTDLESKPLATPAPQRGSTTDKQAFARDLEALRKEVDASVGPADAAHLKRFEWAARLCTLAGYATAWIVVNPVSALLLSTGIFVRWAVVMHHVGHGGYDDVPGIAPRYRSRRFAAGWRRFVDWLDWMPPEAWRFEHNALHHGHTNEESDPDFVLRNTEGIRTEGPLVRRLQLAFFACTWKWSYYMPAAIRAVRFARLRRAGKPSPFDTPEGLRAFYSLASAEGRRQWGALLTSRELWLEGVLPYVSVRFALVPALFLPLGKAAVCNVLLTSLLAELLTNVHAFLVIVPNHAGTDLLRFDSPPGSRAEYNWRQVVASVNYSSPGAWSDFLQGGLNFQIEHHLWPDLPLARYRAYAPRVRELCEKHGLSYREQPLWTRVGMLVDVIFGRGSQRTASPD